ncbi:beta-ketoacyl synthase N-terminal-like domain-containing protein [Fibrobacter sp. UWB12]|uniref:beta-ketoacyl synthase N-terminal-like domain-containing protein n=1 Tax=Fibrobacter sp. UWB12 TaxID=1896203 RepID=UPI00091EF982|nr:beta-ketoacyl synthase N-terminal-like domain-containing protein [Fibrobacter sp. UWB12]SHK70098.1 3-oxoacyl-[acyl-carrier-protein] synthase-1 [Fibrobacter sp. UWB12]
MEIEKNKLASHVSRSKPVYINDFSLYCILGGDKVQVLDALKNGRRGCFTTYDVAGVQRPAATIDPATLAPVQEKKFDNRVNRLSQAALVGIEKTIQKAVEKYGANRVGVFIGSCDNGSEASLAALKQFKETGSFPEGYVLDYQRADFPAQFIAQRYGITGMLSVHSTACASSASAFVSARNNLYADNCDVAIVGGVDIASLSVILGFASLEAMSDRPTNPFSANRSGLTLGDAAVFFVVTRTPDADLCMADCENLKVIGFGESADADHITAPRADGEGAYQAMKAALEDAGLNASQIDYVNLHGTGTELNDAMESRAVQRIFADSIGAETASVPVSSTKALTGHTLGAAGALELAFCCLAMTGNHEYPLPAHLFDGVVDPNLPPLHLVKAGETAKNLKYCMSNSFAFGGCNVSLIVENGGV